MDNLDSRLFPPKQFQIMNYTEKNFTNIGRNHVKFFVNELGLKSTDSVLEIGSGNGRIASALTSYLDEGSYMGVDIMKPFIKWCQKAYVSYDKFDFRHINIYNKFYNRFTFNKSRNFKFPFEKQQFDFIYLTSVFTHMHSEDIDNYLSEIYRMLKPGGTVFITYFLINDETKKLMDEGKSTRIFKLYADKAYTDTPNNPESAIAFDEDFVDSLYRKNNLKISNVSLGKWRCPEKHKSLSHNQDRVVAIKT